MSDIFDHEADAWDSLNDDYWEPINYTPKSVTCKYCGLKRLKWKQLSDGKWRLHFYDSKTVSLKLHTCLQIGV